MALKMTSPWKHPKTGVYWLRKKVPVGLQARLKAEIFQKSLETKDPGEAKVRSPTPSPN